MAASFRIKSIVHGYHVYKAVWSSYIGEEWLVECEVDNIQDDFAVAILKNSMIVDHVPREISRVCWYVLPAEEWLQDDFHYQWQEEMWKEKD